MAQRFRTRPSEALRITDGFAAYCFDEACCWIISQIEDGKRPFFRITDSSGNADSYGNSQTVGMLRKLGAEVKCID